MPPLYHIPPSAHERLLIGFLILFASVSVGTQAQDGYYTLGKGETLYQVSRKLGVSVELLQEINGITDPTRLAVGTRLAVPGFHVVKKDETLYSIARSYNVDVGALAALNAISDPGAIPVGATLLLPGVATPALPGTGDLPVSVTEDASGTPATNTPGLEPAAPGTVAGGGLWPLAGDPQPLVGRLQGVAIRGVPGTPVFSVSSGTVAWESPRRGYGHVVFVRGLDGYIYGYLGNDKSTVSVGDTVVAGAQIGVLGVDPHKGDGLLYFLVFKDGEPVDPATAPRG